MKLVASLVLAALAVTAATANDPNNLRAKEFGPLDATENDNVDTQKKASGVGWLDDDDESAVSSTKSTVASKSSKTGNEPFTFGNTYSDDSIGTTGDQDDDVEEYGTADPSTKAAVASKSSKTGNEIFTLGNTYSDDSLGTTGDQDDDVEEYGTADPSTKASVASKSSKTGNEPFTLGNTYSDDSIGTTGDQDDDVEEYGTADPSTKASKSFKTGNEPFTLGNTYSDDSIGTTGDQDGDAETYGMADPSKMSAKSGGDVYYDDGSDKDLAATLDALLLSAGGTLSRSPPLSSSSSGMPNGEIPLSGDPLPKLLQTPGSEMTLATLMAMLEDPKTQNEISKKDPLEEAFPDTPSGSKAQLDLFDLFDKNAVTPGLDDKKGLIGGEEDTTMVKGASKSNNFAAQNEEEVDVDQDDPVQLQDHPLQFDPQA